MTRILLFSLIFSTLILSPNDSQARSGGVVDSGGGGSFIYHTREEVIQAIDEVWALMTDIKVGNPVGIAIGYSKEADPARGGDPHIARILMTIISAPGANVNEEVPLNTESVKKTTAYIRNQKLRREEDKYCDDKYLASVDRLDRKGRICISVFGLMRLPSGSLRADLMGLLIHEAAHLNGYGEEDAHRVQRYFLKYHRFLMRQAGEYSRYERKVNLYTRATSFWRAVINYDSIDEAYLKSLYRLKFRFKPFLPPVELHDDLGEVLPNLRESVKEELIRLLEDIEDFAHGLEDEWRAGQKAIVPRHLRQMGKIARQMISFELLHHRWLFGEHDFSSRFATMRRRELIREDFENIDMAVDPALLKEPDKRPSLICNNRDKRELLFPPMLSDLSKATWDEVDPFPQPCRDEDLEKPATSLTDSEPEQEADPATKGPKTRYIQGSDFMFPIDEYIPTKPKP